MIKSLSKVKKIVPRPSAKIDISAFTDGESVFLELKEPTAAALFPDSDSIKNLKIKYPKYPDTMIYQVLLLGKCYVNQKDDGDSFNPTIEFAELAKNNKDCFFYVLSEFLNAYPTNDLEKRIDEAKND
jgi:hypothetical protein